MISFMLPDGKTEKQAWRPSATVKLRGGAISPVQWQRRRRASLVFMALLIPFLAYEFWRMWSDPELHPAIAFAASVVIFLFVLGFVGLLLWRPSKHEDDESILRL